RPPWPSSRGQPIRDAHKLRELGSRLQREVPTAVGLWINPDSTCRRHEADDWRSGRPGIVALAVPATDDGELERAPDTEPRTWTLDPTLDPTPLLQWLADPSDPSDPSVPYVVTHGA